MVYLVCCAGVADVKEPEMQIRKPTDMKHVAHIGWDNASITALPFQFHHRPRHSRALRRVQMSELQLTAVVGRVLQMDEFKSSPTTGPPAGPEAAAPPPASSMVRMKQARWLTSVT